MPPNSPRPQRWDQFCSLTARCESARIGIGRSDNRDLGPGDGLVRGDAQGPYSWAWSVAWSFDAARLASASDDGTIKDMGRKTGRCVSTFTTCRRLNHIRRFGESDSQLHTDIGTCELQSVKSSDYGAWITYNRQNLLYLAPEYRITQ